MKLLLFLFGAALAAGLYFVLADLLKIPRLATERALISAGRKERSLVKSLEALILGWSLKLAPLIRLDAYKRRRLETKLTAAGLDMLWENVPGAFSSGTPKGEDFRIVLEEIVRVKCGSVYVPGPYPWPWQSAGRILLGTDFSLAWRCLDAQYWGVAQRRKRIFLVADFAGRTADKILFIPEGVFGDPAPSF